MHRNTLPQKNDFYRCIKPDFIYFTFIEFETDLEQPLHGINWVRFLAEQCSSY